MLLAQSISLESKRLQFSESNQIGVELDAWVNLHEILISVLVYMCYCITHNTLLTNSDTLYDGDITTSRCIQ